MIATLLAALALGGSPQDAAAPAPLPKPDPAVVAKQLPSYPLDVCPVSGEPLGSMGEPVDVVHEGRLVRFCCKSCAKALQKNSAAVVRKVEEAVIAAQEPTYPLDTCVVSGEKLGSMGEPFELVNGTRLVRLCCSDCKAAFEKDPAKHLAKVDAALIAAQLPSYAAKTCPVSGKELGAGGEPVDLIVGTRLVRLCCPMCEEAARAKPMECLAKVYGAPAVGTKAPADEGEGTGASEGAGGGE